MRLKHTTDFLVRGEPASRAGCAAGRGFVSLMQKAPRICVDPVVCAIILLTRICTVQAARWEIQGASKSEVCFFFFPTLNWCD